MNQDDLLGLLQQGDPAAIAALLNRYLQPRGIKAKAALQEGRLHLLLESLQAPNQEAFASYIHRGMTGLKQMAGWSGDRFASVVVYGRQVGEQHPAWTEEIDLTTRDGATDGEPITTPDAAPAMVESMVEGAVGQVNNPMDDLLPDVAAPSLAEEALVQDFAAMDAAVDAAMDDFGSEVDDVELGGDLGLGAFDVGFEADASERDADIALADVGGLSMDSPITASPIDIPPVRSSRSLSELEPSPWDLPDGLGNLDLGNLTPPQPNLDIDLGLDLSTDIANPLTNRSELTASSMAGSPLAAETDLLNLPDRSPQEIAAALPDLADLSLLDGELDLPQVPSLGGHDQSTEEAMLQALLGPDSVQAPGSPGLDFNFDSDDFGLNTGLGVDSPSAASFVAPPSPSRAASFDLSGDVELAELPGPDDRSYSPTRIETGEEEALLSPPLPDLDAEDFAGDLLTKVVIPNQPQAALEALIAPPEAPTFIHGLDEETSEATNGEDAVDEPDWGSDLEFDLDLEEDAPAPVAPAVASKPEPILELDDSFFESDSVPPTYTAPPSTPPGAEPIQTSLADLAPADFPATPPAAPTDPALDFSWDWDTPAAVEPAPAPVVEAPSQIVPPPPPSRPSPQLPNVSVSPASPSPTVEYPPPPSETPVSQELTTTKRQGALAFVLLGGMAGLLSLYGGTMYWLSSQQTESVARASSLTNAIRKAAEATDMESLKQAQTNLRQAIAILEQVPTIRGSDRQVRLELEKNKQELAAVQERLVRENQALENLGDATRLAQEAVAIANKPAPTLGEWRQARDKWQAALNFLQAIPAGTFVSAEAQERLATYQGNLAQVGVEINKLQAQPKKN